MEKEHYLLGENTDIDIENSKKEYTTSRVRKGRHTHNMNDDDTTRNNKKGNKNCNNTNNNRGLTQPPRSVA